MKSNEQLEHALAELRREQRQGSGPAFIGARLRAAVRQRSDQRRRRVFLRWAAAACSLFLLAAALQRPFSPGVPAHRAASGREAPATSGDPGKSGFIALPTSAALPEAIETTLVRVRIRKGDLRQFGLDVPEPAVADMAQAEFALGEDGLARSVRLIEPGSSSDRRPRAR